MGTALIYVRRSFIRKGEEAISPKKQEANCRKICDENGWTPELYRDAAAGKHYTATSEEHRPAWLELKRQMSRPDVVAVVVDSLDRAYRSLKDFLNFLALIDQYKVRFISHREIIDTETVMGRALLQMMMVFFELEAKMASQRTLEVIERRKAAGIHCGSNPFGLERREKGGVFIANEDMQTVALLLKLYATGQESYPSVAKKLNTLGHRFRDHSGNLKPFDRESVRTIVGNVLIYLGYLPQNRKAKNQQRPLVNPDGDLVDQFIIQTDAIRGQHEPFITRELANQVLAAKRVRFKPHRREVRVYLLSDIACCTYCKGPLRGNRERWGNRGYQYRHHGKACRRRLMALDADILEAHAIDLLQALELPPQLQDAIRARAREQEAFLPEDDEAQRATAHLLGKLERLREMRLEGEYSKEEYDLEKARLLEEIQKLDGQTGKLQHRVEYALSDLNNVAEMIRQGPPAAQKAAISAIFERIEVDQYGQITRAVPREWCRPLFATLQEIICPIDGFRGTSETHHAAKLESSQNCVIGGSRGPSETHHVAETSQKTVCAIDGSRGASETAYAAKLGALLDLIST